MVELELNLRWSLSENEGIGKDGFISGVKSVVLCRKRNIPKQSHSYTIGDVRLGL